jgi:hypothetical protein
MLYLQAIPVPFLNPNKVVFKGKIIPEREG